MSRLLSCFSRRRRHSTTPPPPRSSPLPSMPQRLIFNNTNLDSTTSTPSSLSQQLIFNSPNFNSTTLAPPSPPPMPQPLIFSSTISDQPPQSWLEMGLSGHSVTFNFYLTNNQEIVIDMQDPAFLAQIITEGLTLGIEAYRNDMNFPLVDNPEIPFFHPEQPEGPVLAPSIQSQINPLVSLIQVPTFEPSSSGATHESPLPTMALQQGIRPKMYVLNSVKSFIIEEEYIKKYILKCPVRLNKCTMDIRVITNPNSQKKSVVLLVPTLVNLPDDDDEEPPKMSLMIWNCRGSEHSDFHVSFRSMLDYYRPTMVLLLETQMTHHQHLADDFSFSDIANVPAIEGCGGMALVWQKEFVAIDGLVINNEEIHCTINVQ
ncbi:hypothetical protein KY285_017529 [Solanum tuberosum]|uniref:Endonuclease/exonuclease/phosphatase n=1 Tax=Solanum tuberosum TaxID=4113 RepID=M1DWS5_SOLTU|nr:hypothetical protein KY285_017529 [Solanum tuberosum]